jgi:uncharacterized membrane protein YkoI
MKSKNPMRWVLVAGIAAVVALAGPGSTAVAQGEISDERARQIALERVPGSVVSLERDTENGVRVVEVDVRDGQSHLFEIDIDAHSGRIIEVAQDDGEGDDDGEDDDEDDDTDEDAQSARAS